MLGPTLKEKKYLKKGKGAVFSNDSFRISEGYGMFHRNLCSSNSVEDLNHGGEGARRKRITLGYGVGSC